MVNKYYKSPHLLVYPNHEGPGWFIKHYESGTIVHLPQVLYDCWATWDLMTFQAIDPHRFGLLIEYGMIAQAGCALSLPEEELDGWIPETTQLYAKSYAESCDTVVLFNTACLEINNPLVVLSSYGSFCWNQLNKNQTVGVIRRESQRLFGADEVIPFYHRLMDLGFIQRIKTASSMPDRDIRIIKEFFAPQIQYELMRTRIPWYAIWELCTICDLRCRTCYLPEFDQYGIKGPELYKLAENLVAGGLFYIGLLGGEVLLRDDLEALIACLRESGVFVKVITNGHGLSPARARSLMHTGLNEIEISFDGLTAATHDASRGRGSYRKALIAMRNAAEAGIPRRAMVWTLHSGNVREIDFLHDFMHQHQIHECYISAFRKTGLLGSRAPWLPLSEHQKNEIRSSLQDEAAENSDLTITLSSECSCGRSSIVISADGTMRLCTFLRAPIGNLLNESITDLWAKLDLAYSGVGPFGYCKNSPSDPEQPLILST